LNAKGRAMQKLLSIHRRTGAAYWSFLPVAGGARSPKAFAAACARAMTIASSGT